MDYKDTLLLPTTNFQMRGNLPENEPKRYKEWFGNRNVYNKMKENRKNANSSFNLHDGPPYANGNIHIGHALNKILKDIIVKTHYFFGEDVRYLPGWDCHGLPIEQQVEVAVGGREKKEAISKVAFRELCREHAKKFVNIQKDEFKALGVIGDWDNPYLTMKYAFEADIYRALCSIAKKGLIVERNKPVIWSWAARSALAEAEVEYKDKEDYSIFVAFKLDTLALEKLGVDEASAVIWTTTPWTLPANVAIAFSPDEEYVLTNDKLIIAKKRVEALKELGITSGEITKVFNADILENSFAINPLNSRKSQLVLGSHVSMDGGSGLVHTAPGHGDDDYRTGLLYGLDVIVPVDDDGKYDSTIEQLALLPNAKEFLGLHVFKANEKILELLGSSLLHSSKFIHSYPYCWRTHTPIIYRATKQWFISMDDNKALNLRKSALGEIDKLKFYPESGYKRLYSMIENRPDWCISRQRDWGVPIAFFRDKNTKEAIFDEDVLDNIASIFEKYGADAWWSMSIEELLPKNSKYDAKNLEKVMDILDVWFDSGSTWSAVLNSKNYDAGNYPANMYLEGSDQHRGWFQSSLLISTAINEHAPYKSILTHGFTVDEKGEKMSKSKGNVVAPNDIAKKYGVEILRLWVGTSDYTTELKISENIIKQVSEQYRKIRNTFRFLLAGIDDLEEIIEIDKLGILDKWILKVAKKTFDDVESAFKEYNFSKGYFILANFIAVELSGIYLDISKDRLYCDEKNSNIRRSTQSAMAMILKSFLGLVAPVLTYTVDEIMEHAPKTIKKENEDAFDVEYQKLPDIHCELNGDFLIEVREKFFEIVDRLKKDKVIKSTLELNLVTTSNELKKFSLTDAEDWFTISEVVEQSSGEILGEFSVNDEKFVIVKALKHKCPRCWKFKAESEECLCQRCQGVVGV